MKIAIIQHQPQPGNVEANMELHLNFLSQIKDRNVDFCFFSELSLTGYEPELADELAFDAQDPIFSPVQEFSNLNHISIGLGLPIRFKKGVTISMLLFSPTKPRKVYSKHHLHQDEFPFFIPGMLQTPVFGDVFPIGLSICYELSVPKHTNLVFNQNPACYVASVAKTEKGMVDAAEILQSNAFAYSCPTLICNAIGKADNFICGGKSAIWDANGNLLMQLTDKIEAALIYDSDTASVEKIDLSRKILS